STVGGSARVASNACTAVADQKIEIGTEVCLLYVLDKDPLPTSFGQRRRCPLHATCGQCTVVDLKLNGAPRDIKSNHVAGAHQGERTASSGFRRHVQDDRSVRSSAHAGIGDSDHIRYTLAQQ